MTQAKAKPIVKWAGGKGQLLSQFSNYYPTELRTNKINKYAEPFMGGGAVFFEVMQTYRIQSAYISDVNKDLVLTYWVVQQKPQDLLHKLYEYQKIYENTSVEKRNDLFLLVREEFNQKRFTTQYQTLSDDWIIRAAQLIFLNKTCFNGLFRLNSKGGFNVPFGKYPKPTILDEQNIWAASRILQRTEIQIANYDACFDHITDNTFVYFDPPYRPISKTASFNTYASGGFSEQDQIKLAHFFRKINTEKQAKLMLSNSDPKNENPEDNFFENIFNDFPIYRVSASRAINSNAEKRGAINEIVVTNYQPTPANNILF